MHIFSERYQIRNAHRLAAGSADSSGRIGRAAGRKSPELTRAELRDIILGQLG
jgi:hypothetical protein